MPCGECDESDGSDGDAAGDAVSFSALSGNTFGGQSRTSSGMSAIQVGPARTIISLCHLYYAECQFLPSR